MANYERGSDDVRVFDGGEDEEDVEGSRLPLLIVIALLVLAAFAAVVWIAYQKGVAQGHSDVPRVIAAEPGPAKVAPTNAGGTPTPYTGLKIYQQPAPSDAEADSDTAAPAQPAVQTPPAAKPPAAKPMAAETAPVTPAPKPTTMAAATPPATKPPTTKPQVTTPPPAVTKPVTPPAVQSAPATKPVETAATTPAPAGGPLLQIGSYKSEAEASAAWTAYKARHASLVGGLSPNIKQVDLGAKGTWYRLRIAGGASLCDKLKAEGAACIPTK